MKCEICKTEIPREKNSVVCSDRCSLIRKRLFEIENKYFPTHGCDNCWSDSHGGCTEECKREFKVSFEFCKDMWSLIDQIYP